MFLGNVIIEEAIFCQHFLTLLPPSVSWPNNLYLANYILHVAVVLHHSRYIDLQSSITENSRTLTPSLVENVGRGVVIITF